MEDLIHPLTVHRSGFGLDHLLRFGFMRLDRRLTNTGRVLFRNAGDPVKIAQD